MTDELAAHARATIDKVIEVTAWRNVRRYVILSSLATITVTLAVAFTVTYLVAVNLRDTQRQACENSAQLAEIQRETVRANEEQTAGLRAQGITFGIPPAEFDRLVAEGARRSAQQIRVLDEIAKAACG